MLKILQIKSLNNYINEIKSTDIHFCKKVYLYILFYLSD